MTGFLLRRLGMAVLALVAVSLVAFLVPYLGQDDPVRAIIRARTSDPVLDAATEAGLKAQLGLDRPLPAQYFAWLGRALAGDLGLSYGSRVPVGLLIGRALAVSATLAITALGVAVAVALPIGTACAVRAGRLLDGATAVVCQALVALPEYGLAPAFILVFALRLHWLPSAGWDRPGALIMPAAVLALRPLAYFTRVTRASMLDVLQAPYIVAARSRGLGLGRTLWRHGLRNGLTPVATLSAMWLASLIGGSVVVEVIFAVPGMGRLVYEAVINKDVPLLQGGLLCIVALSVAISTAADLLHQAANPALRMRRADG